MQAALPAGAPATALGADRRVIALVSAAHFFSHLYILILPPIFPVLQEALGVSALQLGLAIAAANVTTMLAQTPVGFLVDRLGAGAVLIAGHTAMAAAVAATALVPSFEALLLTMVAAGLGNAVYHPADYTILAGRVATTRVGRAFSIHTFGGYAGFAAAPLTMVPLTEAFGWRAALGIVGVAGLIMGAILLLRRHDLASVARKAAPSPVAGKRSDMALLRSTPVLLSLLFFVLLSLTHTGLGSFAPATLHALYDLSLVEANLPVTIYFVVSALGVLLGGWLADRTPHHGRVVAACAAVTASTGAVAALLTLDLAALCIAFALAGLAAGVIAPSRDMLVRAVTPAGSSGKVFGFVMTGFNIGALIAPPVYGLLLDLGQPRLVFASVAVFGALIIVTVVRNRGGSIR